MRGVNDDGDAARVKQRDELGHGQRYRGVRADEGDDGHADVELRRIVQRSAHRRQKRVGARHGENDGHRQRLHALPHAQPLVKRRKRAVCCR